MAVEELELSWLAGRADREAAFEEFLVRHQKLVLRTAWRMLGRLEDAQDAAQDVFLKAHKHFGEITDGTAAAWMYRVTLNVCYDALRRRRVEVDEFPELRSEADQLDSVEREQRKQALQRALMKLPEKERAAVVLREIEGLETSEVAAILGSTETTVRSQISAARGKLRGWLEGVRR